MRILVTGASGMLGKAVYHRLSREHEVVGLSQHPLGSDWITADLIQPASWRPAVERFAPQAIIHTAANTQVDRCESDPPAAEVLNEEVVKWMAEIASRHGASLVQISTDSVFDGQDSRPYSEDAPTHPLNVYGRTKLAGEKWVLAYEKGLILRTNIFGWRKKTPVSFGEWVLNGLRKREELTMFIDVDFTPLYCGHLAGIIERCLADKVRGLFHAGSRDVKTKFEFGVLTAEIFDLPKDSLLPVRVADKGLAANRPKHMALDSSRLESVLGMKFPTVSEGIQAWKEQENESD